MKIGTCIRSILSVQCRKDDKCFLDWPAIRCMIVYEFPLIAIAFKMLKKMRILHERSFHMKFMKQAFGEFHKFYIK